MPRTRKSFSHLDAQGEVAMVDVSHKPPMLREAEASGEIRLQPATLRRIRSFRVAKGNVLATARLAAIQAAKRTSDLIPLCHPIPISHLELTFHFPSSRDRIVLTATARTVAGTGIEMEALTAVAVAALTIYDMCKAVDTRMRIGNIRLLRKTKKPLAPSA